MIAYANHDGSRSPHSSVQAMFSYDPAFPPAPGGYVFGRFSDVVVPPPPGIGRVISQDMGPEVEDKPAKPRSKRAAIHAANCLVTRADRFRPVMAGRAPQTSQQIAAQLVTVRGKIGRPVAPEGVRSAMTKLIES